MSICEAYRLSASNARGQHFTMPSMTEDAHILSLEQIMKDYTRGVVHSFGERQPLYDDGDDIVEVSPIEDLTDLPLPRTQQSVAGSTFASKVPATANKEGSGDGHKLSPERSSAEAMDDAQTSQDSSL